MDVGPVAQEGLLNALSKMPLERRLAEASERFIGTPYAPSPLGEGHGIDEDPPLRFDAVDCLTFVEETIALSLSANLKEMDGHLTALRYRSQPDYQDRNHLMEAQWLPNNLGKRYLTDVTAEYGGLDTVSSVKVVGLDAWRSPAGQRLNLSRGAQVTGTFPLNWIPLERAAQRMAEVPSGTLMVVVREDRPARVTRVSHLGFLIRQGGKAFIRHAAKSVFARVVDEELEHFLLRNSRYAYAVQGIALYTVNDPGRGEQVSVQTADAAH